MHLRRIQQPWVILGIDNPFVLRASPDRTIRQSPTHNGQVRPDYGLGWKKEGKCAEAIGAGDTGAGTELGHVGPWGEKIRKRENYMENMEIAGFTFFCIWTHSETLQAMNRFFLQDSERIEGLARVACTSAFSEKQFLNVRGVPSTEYGMT